MLCKMTLRDGSRSRSGVVSDRLSTAAWVASRNSTWYERWVSTLHTAPGSHGQRQGHLPAGKRPMISSWTAAQMSSSPPMLSRLPLF